MSLLWATRGHTWGFRFLRDGDLADPLVEYERMFPTTRPPTPPLQRVASKVAVRLDEPDGRRDRSGRLIEHDFIVDCDLADQVHSVDDARRLLWPLVRDEYAAVWHLPDPDRPR